MTQLLGAAKALLDAVRREEADEYMRQEVMDLQYAIFRAEHPNRPSCPHEREHGYCTADPNCFD